MAAIKKVAVLGGSGNIGPSIIKALLNSNFEVTAITRLESQATFVDGVDVKRVDITSKEAVQEVLQGHDALVSAISSAALDDQKTIVDAAVAAKVRRFIPSEYGVDNRRTEEKDMGWMVVNKAKLNEYLDEVAAKHKWFSWTGVACGFFFDWGIQTQFILGINARAKTGVIIDSGNKPWAATNTYFVGETVAAILKKPEETANKFLNVFSFKTTQNEVLRIFEEESGSKYHVSHVKGSDLLEAATACVANGDYKQSTGPFVQHVFFADGVEGPVDLEANDGELLGIKDKAGLRDSIKRELSLLN
ncbi:hypothetical protein TRIATDRAFT_293732 [Trichoderma atroviride IMI 206040]|uniref:NmrA-like domain-containing protein n=1 Tax=Hypocrea atroviridis (strain ATCC 20476 / IMI 206040) TaxID=452589 RepID=G9NYZ6_HYPAI|nr:uncharacterized protein TRIATDRAFT_293732 [Trichoderma atroviride IMI 206040]EHK44548.1 hypothetical protein TRIATDRAFT_293732 [Trichoderma atroviride IMI 206040]